MNMKGKRDFRNKIHFTPEKMWMNDPNGLLYENGNYHLFYQYYPEKTVWGPMHWGHAVSKDLISWEHLPTALYPDEELGYIFSGSAVYDEHNTSGLGENGKNPIVLMFTHHGKTEQQSLAYSLDGVNFVKYSGNPVIPNKDIQDFRDPKIFKNPTNNLWSMVLAAGDKVIFYKSANLINWEYTGSFGPSGNYAPGVWECPDIFPLDTPDGEKWVLLVSMGMDEDDGGSRTQYFIGNFDGDTFVCTEPFDKAVFINQGFDSYAGVTFSGLDNPLLLAWGINWKYAADSPTNEYRGLMTLPHTLSLANTPLGYRLACTPFALKEANNRILHNSSMLRSEVFGLKIYADGECKIELSNKDGQSLSFGIDNQNNIFVDRSHAGDNKFSRVFERKDYSVRSTPRYFDGSMYFDFIFDVSIFEIFADNYVFASSNVVYPDSPYDKLNFAGDVEITYYDIDNN